MTRQVAEKLAEMIAWQTSLSANAISKGQKYVVIIYGKPRDYTCYTPDECAAFIAGYTARQLGS